MLNCYTTRYSVITPRVSSCHASFFQLSHHVYPDATPPFFNCHTKCIQMPRLLFSTVTPCVLSYHAVLDMNSNNTCDQLSRPWYSNITARVLSCCTTCTELSQDTCSAVTCIMLPSQRRDAVFALCRRHGRTKLLGVRSCTWEPQAGARFVFLTLGPQGVALCRPWALKEAAAYSAVPSGTVQDGCAEGYSSGVCPFLGRASILELSAQSLDLPLDSACVRGRGIEDCPGSQGKVS